MNGYEVNDMIDDIECYSDGLRNYDVILEYYAIENVLCVKKYQKDIILNSYNNVSLSNLKQLLYNVNRCIKKDDGFERLIEIKISYR